MYGNVEYHGIERRPVRLEKYIVCGTDTYWNLAVHKRVNNEPPYVKIKQLLVLNDAHQCLINLVFSQTLQEEEALTPSSTVKCLSLLFYHNKEQQFSE